MKKIKSARHHWWPQGVSKHWAAVDGTTGWIKPDGSCIRVPPKQLGVIGNAHQIKLGRTPGESTAWDTNFESEFEVADNQFPNVIAWLQSLERVALPIRSLTDRFLPQAATVTQLRALTECVVSLAVRSPMNREASVAIPERFNPVPLVGQQRDALIGANMMRSQRLIADSIGADGKFAAVYSEAREFIYGDGFFHNVTAVVNPPHMPKIVAPITPHISVIVCRPTSYMVEPRLTTIVLTAEEVDQFNHALQVYSRQALFFRSERPLIDQVFRSGQHLRYTDPDNPIDRFIRGIPGIPDRNRRLDALFPGAT